MKPTNKELNILCARCMNIFVGSGVGPQQTNYITYRDCPDYCSERNALDGIYYYITQQMYEDDLWERFVVATRTGIYFEDKWDNVEAWLLMTLEPKQQVIAFIKATGNWPEEWEE